MALVKVVEDEKRWCVYMILTHQQALYTGITTDLERRFQQHLDMFNGVANSRGAKFFRAHKPLAVRYKASFSNRSDASRHEYYLKQLTKKQKMVLVESHGQA